MHCKGSSSPFGLEDTEDAEHPDECGVWDMGLGDDDGDHRLDEERKRGQGVADAAVLQDVLDASRPARVLVALDAGPQPDRVLNQEEAAAHGLLHVKEVAVPAPEAWHR